jgi:hypothetical protein
MATIYGAIRGIEFIHDAPNSGNVCAALISFTLPAYTASSDNGQLGGAGFVNGVANTATLATIIQNARRDGKTVTLGAPPATTVSVAVTVQSGLTGSTQYYPGTFTVSGGNLLFNVGNVTGTEVDAASGIVDRPVKLCVGFTVA